MRQARCLLLHAADGIDGRPAFEDHFKSWLKFPLLHDVVVHGDQLSRAQEAKPAALLHRQAVEHVGQVRPLDQALHLWCCA